MGRGRCHDPACSFRSGDVFVPATVGSTHRWETDADHMRAALAADVALRDRRGMVASCSSTQRRVCAAFASPRYAVDAAVAAQRGAGVAGADGVGNRRDCATGSFGAVLDRTTRVMAAGHGGQILLADSTAVLLTGVDLLDLGPRRLRDVSAHQGVFQVPALGLRPHCGHWIPVWESAACRRHFYRTRTDWPRCKRHYEGSSVGDVDRGGRGR